MTQVLLVLVQICFASLAVFGKAALVHVPPNAIVLVRVAGAAAVFALVARGRGRVPRRELPLVLLASFLGVVLNQLLYVNGLARTTAVDASVLQSTIPVFTAAVAMIARREPARPLRIAGIAVAFAGSLVLLRVDRFTVSDASTVGNLMILANSLCYGTFLVLVRSLAPRVPALPLVGMIFALAVPFILPFGVPAWIGFAPTGRDLALLAFILAVPTLGAYGLNQLALVRAEASMVASYAYLQPLLSTVGALLILGERPELRVYIAGAVIVAGLYLASLERRRASSASRPS